jgi:hypothetical protein
MKRFSSPTPTILLGIQRDPGESGPVELVDLF